uniref:Adaptor protein ClpS core domain-containing protein n=1 Tax=Pseudo-nitzschia delicatissima TaxID=44447 RepID=A0A7S0TA78_9STRA|mmetsp:Transcript_1124/g.2563  ORF Transcript_1124/g.2563 Transcript_1124/m.2563 type:complete len:188 (+) Transcript_1124:183-746(+)
MSFNSYKIKQQKRQSRRRSACSTMMLLTSAATVMSDVSALQPQLQMAASTRFHTSPSGSFQSPTSSPISSKTTTSSVEFLDRLANELDGAMTIDKLSSNKDESDQNNENDEWELWIYNDNTNSRESVARALVQVAGRSELEAFHTMNEAHTIGIALVDSHLRFEIAEAYHEGLRKHGILSEIVPLMD